MVNEMDFIEKVLNCVVWLLIVSGMLWFAYGCYELINLFFWR